MRLLDIRYTYKCAFLSQLMRYHRQVLPAQHGLNLYRLAHQHTHTPRSFKLNTSSRSSSTSGAFKAKRNCFHDCVEQLINFRCVSCVMASNTLAIIGQRVVASAVSTLCGRAMRGVKSGGAWSFAALLWALFTSHPYAAIVHNSQSK